MAKEKTKTPGVGIYSAMSDIKLRQCVEKWADQSPEEFWQDGEYTGTAASRVREVMARWRCMKPTEQQKHYDELMG